MSSPLGMARGWGFQGFEVLVPELLVGLRTRDLGLWVWNAGLELKAPC